MYKTKVPKSIAFMQYFNHRLTKLSHYCYTKGDTCEFDEFLFHSILTKEMKYFKLSVS